MKLILEDGTGVAGANTLLSLQEAAAFQAERGGLIPVLGFASSSITFAAGGVLTAPAGTFAGVEAQSIIELAGTGPAANRGFAYLVTAAEDRLTLLWLTTQVEAPGAALQLTVFDKSGWWHPAPARLESSLVNATHFACKRYEWGGTPAGDVQALPWPRRNVIVGPGSLYYAPYYALPDGVIPIGLKRCISHLSLADIEETLESTVDPRASLVSKDIGVSGIKKVFGGPVRRRRFPHADSEVSGLTSFDSVTSSGPFFPLIGV